MLIEKEISEKYFRNKCHKAIVNVFFTSNWLVEKLKSAIESEDITPQQYNLLRVLNISDKPLSTLKIREQMLDKMSDTSRIVERLQKKGLVQKKVAAHDKRLVDVSLTEKGAELVLRLDERASTVDTYLAALGDANLEHLNKLLDKIRENE